VTESSEKSPPTGRQPSPVQPIFAPKPPSTKPMVRRGARIQPFKNPSYAALIATMSPGSGQLYVGYLQRGFLAFALSFLCGIGYFWGIYDAYQLAVKANAGEIDSSDKYVIHAYFTLPLLVVFSIIGIGALIAWKEWHYIRSYLDILNNIIDI
jgi:hypothetical protein